MTVLKSEIYTMTSLILSKKFFCQSLKKRTSLIANCLINIFQKLNQDQKAPLWKFEKTFYVNVKTIFGLYLSFAINFMLELKMSFKKKFDMTPGLI